jgi:hypothetical protein
MAARLALRKRGKHLGTFIGADIVFAVRKKLRETPLRRGFDFQDKNARCGIMAPMTKLLEKAIAKVREFPDEDQDAFAAALLSMAGEETPVVHLDEESRTAVHGGLAQAKRGEFVPDEEMDAFFKQHDL